MSLLAYAHWRDPVNRHALLPGVHIPYGETAATVNGLTSAAVAANLLDMTALTSWLTGCPWLRQPHSRLKQHEVALLRQFRGLAVAVPDHQGAQAASGHQGGAALPAPPRADEAPHLGGAPALAHRRRGRRDQRAHLRRGGADVVAPMLACSRRNPKNLCSIT